MQILHLCPANLATGGTEGIHHLVSELNKCGADAKIWYTDGDLSNPQPKEYKKYNCAYVTEFSDNFSGIVIFPEVWGNRVLEEQFKNCKVAINWQGVDVYNWHTPIADRGKFLQRENVVHITMSEYGMNYLKNLGLNPIKISDCIADEYFSDYTEPSKRADVVLYNPTRVKMTRFQQIVMARATTELGVRFKPIEHYTQAELIDLFRHSKLYIDFGVFSGRERLPREAVTQGCCILTSQQGTAKDYLDNSIPEKYKFDTTDMVNIDKTIRMISYILHNYELCKPDFIDYKNRLKQDLSNYHKEVEEFYNAI